MTQPCFADRAEAGRQLAVALNSYRGTGAVVLGIPRGGVVVAAEVARALNADLDVVVTKKLGAPGQQELAIGAVAADGGRYLNDGLIRELSVSDSYLESVTAVQTREARDRERRLRTGRPPVPLDNRTAIIVDDGLATGATAIAAVRSLKNRHPMKVIVAAPVGSDRACDLLRGEASVVCPYELADLVAIGYYYLEFPPVDEDSVRELLAAASRPVAR